MCFLFFYDRKKLLIIPITNSDSYKFKSLFEDKPIQNKKFKFGIKIKNIGNSPISTFKIKDIKISENSVPGYCSNCLDEYETATINPGEIRKIWFHNITFPKSGQILVRLTLDTREQIRTYQYDIANNEFAKHEMNNWMNFIHILDEHVYHQKIMNWLLVILTTLTAFPFIIKTIQYLVKLYV